MMLTTLRLHESFSGEMLKHYKYHVDSIIQVPYWNPFELLLQLPPIVFNHLSHILWYLIVTVFQCKKNKTITSQLEISDPIFYTGMELNEFTVIDLL